jgi:hypothetical protein
MIGVVKTSSLFKKFSRGVSDSSKCMDMDINKVILGIKQ